MDKWKFELCRNLLSDWCQLYTHLSKYLNIIVLLKLPPKLPTWLLTIFQSFCKVVEFLLGLPVYRPVNPVNHPILLTWKDTYEPPHDKTNKMACAPSEDSDQPGHPPSLIRVFAVRMKKPWIFSYPLCTQWRLWSDWADAQADLILRWVHSHSVGFVMRQLKS